MSPPPAKQLISLCDQLLAAVEELLLAGLTTASKSTIERIDVSFKEASRMRLLRLGSTLPSPTRKFLASRRVQSSSPLAGWRFSSGGPGCWQRLSAGLPGPTIRPPWQA